MLYGIVVSSDAHIHTGVTVKIKDAEDDEKYDFYVLEDGQHCCAMPKKCIDLISPLQFEVFESRTKLIKAWLSEMDKEEQK